MPSKFEKARRRIILFQLEFREPGRKYWERYDQCPESDLERAAEHLRGVRYTVKLRSENPKYRKRFCRDFADDIENARRILRLVYKPIPFPDRVHPIREAE